MFIFKLLIVVMIFLFFFLSIDAIWMRFYYLNNYDGELLYYALLCFFSFFHNPIHSYTTQVDKVIFFFVFILFIDRSPYALPRQPKRKTEAEKFPRVYKKQNRSANYMSSSINSYCFHYSNPRSIKQASSTQ